MPEYNTKVYPANIKSQAMLLRKKGCSLKEVCKELKIAKSTASVWLSNVEISNEGKLLLEQKKKATRQNLIRYITVNKIKKGIWHGCLVETAKRDLKQIIYTKTLNRLLCSLLYWAEGAKDLGRVTFTNSDPKMVSIFLKLFKDSFNINPIRIRACLHLHEYHNEVELKSYWSKVTTIPLNQFMKSYRKPHTGIRKKAGYKGCVNISYGDFRIAHELNAIYNAYVCNELDT